VSRGKIRQRTLRPIYERNVQPFAGSAVSGRCLDPLKVAVARDSCKNYRLKKEHKRREQNEHRRLERVSMVTA
jgi:hypothetical protein